MEFDYVVDPSAIYETGIVETNGWTTVNTMGTYTSPIVVASPVEGYGTSADSEVATAIVTNITSSSFRVQLRIESSTIAGNVSYIVVGNGTHVLSNGMLLQAGRVENVNSYNRSEEHTSELQSH